MSSFPPAAKGKRGYKPEQVDEFLARTRAVFEGQSEGVTALDIRRTAFDVQKNGYDTHLVDTALERLENVFAERERAASRSKLGDSAWLAEARATAQVIVNRLGRPDGQRFSRAGALTHGYSVADVDRFASRLIRYFTEGKAITVDEVRTVVFRSQRHGYAEAQVDLLLDAVTDVMLAVK